MTGQTSTGRERAKTRRGRRAGLLAVALLAVLGVFAVVAGAATQRRSTTRISVWLMVDAKSWPAIVDAANRAFEDAHPGVAVKVSYLPWGTHLAKLDAALKAGKAPDVTEMGSTEMTRYTAAGSFAPLSPSTFDNSQAWLGALEQSARFGGKLFGVPYYASARAAIIRTDLWRNAGISKLPPTSLGEFTSDGVKLMEKYGTKDPSFSALYFPGQNWYAATSWVYDYGGSIAIRTGGAWKGNLNSPKSIAGLNELKKDVLALSRADKTGTEANEWTTFSKGHVASMIGNGWEVGLITDAKAGDPALAPVISAFPMPSHVKGRTMPVFLSGSDLAVPASSSHKALATDWIRFYTSTTSERRLASEGGLIPNAKSLLSTNDAKPLLAPFAHAAASSWFVPTAPRWSDVENAKVMQNLYVQILTGRMSVTAAANNASAQITRILNAP